MQRKIKSALQHTLTVHGRTQADALEDALRNHACGLDTGAHMWEIVQDVRDRFWHKSDRLNHGVDTF